MDKNGFAFKSGKLQYNDRVLACNGVDLTKVHTTQQIKDIFYRMAEEPLLRMAISRGDNLPEAGENKASADTSGESHVTYEEREGSEDEEEDSEYGNIHIVELHKEDEPLGIILTHYTSPDGV